MESSDSTGIMNPPFIVQSIFPFKGQNNDELCFKKGDMITVTQAEEGGWWEGTLGDKTGWFPSNYVKECKPLGNDLLKSVTLSSSKTSIDLLAQQTANRAVIVNDLIESEKAHIQELDDLVDKFLIPINSSKVISTEDYYELVGNIAEIVEVHEALLKGLKDGANLPLDQQRIGKLFLTSASEMKRVHQTYCLSHPSAVMVLQKHKEKLDKIMEENGASSPGILVLTVGLSKPFRRLDKYAGILQELKRHMEEGHVDRGDIQRSVAVYKEIASGCWTLRRQRELQLQVLHGGVSGWEGDSLTSLGKIIHIGSVAKKPDMKDRYFVLFPSTLLILSVSNTMSSFVYEGKLPLTGIQVTKLEDTNDTYKNAFRITGPMIEEIVAICQTKEDQKAWVEKIEQQIRASQPSVCKSACQVVCRNSREPPSSSPPPPPPPHGRFPSISSSSGSSKGEDKESKFWCVTHLRISSPARSCLIKTPDFKQPRKICDATFAKDAQILQVIEAYCVSAAAKYSANSNETNR